MKDTNLVDAIAAQICQKFKCFGGGRGWNDNPIAEALDKQPLMFALGVDVRSVIRFVIECLGER